MFASLCTAVGSKIKLPVNEIGSHFFGVLAAYLVLPIDFGFFSVGNSVYEQYLSLSGSLWFMHCNGAESHAFEHIVPIDSICVTI